MDTKKIIAFLFSLLLPIVVFANESTHSARIPFQHYWQQAQNIYNSMSLDERIGQLLLPTYRLLATAVPTPAGKKAGELCQIALNTDHPVSEDVMTACGLDQIEKSQVGAVLADGGPYYNTPTLDHWHTLNTLAVRIHQKLPHDPMLLMGSDAIHGNNHVEGAVIFPHDINLGVTHDAALVEKIGALTADDVLFSGFNWVYMPAVAVAKDLRWGRTYESFAEDPVWVKILGRAYIKGFQHIENGKVTGVLASVKHFLGDGATQYGLDEGNAVFSGDLNAFWQANGLGYEGAIEAGVLNFMVSYSALNGDRMHMGGQWDIVNRFKTTGIPGSNHRVYQCQGFSVSDYNGPTRASYFYNLSHPNHPLATLPEKFAKSINAGVDMIMLGNGDVVNPFEANSDYNYTSVTEAAKALKIAVQQGLIPEARFRDAVTRVLAVKLAMHSKMKAASYAALQTEQRALALRAAEESLVLLKNANQTLPLKKNQLQSIKNIIFLGATDDLGVQNGGWTINWQGQKGDQYFRGDNKKSSGANTLQQALLKNFPLSIHVLYRKDVPASLQDLTADNTLVITAVAEPPYAEYMGDIANSKEVDRWYQYGIDQKQNVDMPQVQSHQLQLAWTADDAAMVQSLQAKGIRVISIVYSGRPVVLTAGTAPLTHSDAVIAAFLPGTLGGDALANAMLGTYRFRQNKESNTLTFPWPRDMNDVIDHFKHGELFKVGYGLSSSSTNTMR